MGVIDPDSLDACAPKQRTEYQKGKKKKIISPIPFCIPVGPIIIPVAFFTEDEDGKEELTSVFDPDLEL